MTDYRQTPQDIQAERSIIGACLLDNGVISDVLNSIAIEDFYDGDNRMFFAAIRELNIQNKPIDLITVLDQLGTNKTNEIIQKLTNMAMEVPTVANTKHYISIVKEKSIRRQFIRSALKVIDMSYELVTDGAVDFRNEALKEMDIKVSENKEELTIQNMVMNTIDDIHQRRDSKEYDGIFYGFEHLDLETGGAHRGELTLLASRPSVGKTALALQFAVNMSKHKKHIAIFSLEMGYMSLLQRIISNIGGVSNQKVRIAKQLSDVEFDIIDKVAFQMYSTNLHIFDKLFCIEDIRSACRDLKNIGQLDYIILDYLQLCDTQRKFNSLNESTGYISRILKLMSVEFNVPVLALSQLNRNNERDEREPQLIDLRNSGSLEQDADNVFFLHDGSSGKYVGKEDLAKKTSCDIDLIIAKQRNGLRDLKLALTFNKDIQRVVDASDTDWANFVEG